jgi:CubicO group peptidase (beta-lactamase class C family)
MRPSAFDTQEFDEHVRRLLTEWKVPGIAVAVVDRDDTIVKVGLLLLLSEA